MMSEERQVIDFLRRRYASAILRDDAPTAGRLRAQLDDLMNHAGPRRIERTGPVGLYEQATLPHLGQPWMARAMKPATGSTARRRSAIRPERPICFRLDDGAANTRQALTDLKIAGR